VWNPKETWSTAPLTTGPMAYSHPQASSTIVVLPAGRQTLRISRVAGERFFWPRAAALVFTNLEATEIAVPVAAIHRRRGRRCEGDRGTG